MVLVAAVGFDLLNHFFDILNGVAVCNQHGVFGLHNHQVFDPHGSHQAGLGIHVAIFGFVANDIAMMDIALCGMRTDLPQG